MGPIECDIYSSIADIAKRTGEDVERVHGIAKPWGPSFILSGLWYYDCETTEEIVIQVTAWKNEQQRMKNAERAQWQTGNPPCSGRYLATWQANDGQRIVDLLWFVSSDTTVLKTDDQWHAEDGVLIDSVIAWSLLPGPYDGSSS